MAISIKNVNCEHGQKPADCPFCLRLWAEYMEDQRELDELAHRDALIRAAAPATDREWEEHLAACDPGRASCGEGL